MGQAASKAKEAAIKAAKDPRISKAIQTQRTRSAAEAQWKQTTTSTTGEYSPTRGHNQPTTTTSTNEKMPEMPPDLIKFLNDAGPLQRTVDKELTSTKVYEALVSDESIREEHTKQANLRVRRRMPIVSYKDHDDLIQRDEWRNKNKIEEDDDGTMVTRTTNFSTRDRSKDGVEFGLDRMELFQLALKLKKWKVNSAEWKEEVENEFQQIRRRKILSSKGENVKDFGQLKDFALFENSMRFIGVPVLMKDEENDIIGVKSGKVEDLRFSNLREIPEEKAIFVMKAEEAKESNSSTQ
eukprot:scaffold545_cov139-Skeletonema_menzelii.AAC.8